MVGGVVETEASVKHPDRNEDAAFLDPEKGVAGIFDGLGGVTAGDKASARAAEFLAQNADKLPSRGTQEQAESAMSDLIKNMSAAVAEVRNLPEVRASVKEYLSKNGLDPTNETLIERVGEAVSTTAEVVKIWQDKGGKSKVTIGGAGDSRVYRLRGGKLTQLSRDDSPITALKELGIITDNQPLDEEMPRAMLEKAALAKPTEMQTALDQTVGKETFSLHDIRNIVTQSLGADTLLKRRGQEFKPNVQTFDVEEEDELFLVSDGPSDNVSDEEMEGIANKFPGQPDLAARETKKLAYERSKGGHPRSKADDVTIIALKIGK